MEPIRGEVGLLSEGIWGGAGDARTGGGVGEAPLEAVSTSFASASFKDDSSALTSESTFADSVCGGNAPSSVAALMAIEREAMLLAMQQEAMGMVDWESWLTHGEWISSYWDGRSFLLLLGEHVSATCTCEPWFALSRFAAVGAFTVVAARHKSTARLPLGLEPSNAPQQLYIPFNCSR
jgi:hypothetical protein